MKNSKLDQYKERFLLAWQNLIKKSDDDTAFVGRERIVVFGLSLILALCLWLMVNLSRDYSLNMDVPITLGIIPVDEALAEDLPEKATVNITGEGWKLINIYNNPPGIQINVNDAEVNLYDQVQKQLNDISNVSVQKVQPLFLTLDLEKRVSKKVPIKPVVEVSFEKQYHFMGETRIQPDSVTISGAASLVDQVTSWPTDTVNITNVSKNISQPIDLKAPSKLISLSRSEVIYNASVTQYTEGEVKIAIQTKELPVGRNVKYSPAALTLKFEVPIDEYKAIKDQNPFQAFVNYEQINEDSTGFVRPHIEQIENDYHIQIRSSQPARVAYFIVLDE